MSAMKQGSIFKAGKDNKRTWECTVKGTCPDVTIRWSMKPS